MVYFLHIWHGGDSIEEQEAKQFTDLRAAFAAAAESVRDLLIEMVRERRRADGAGSYVEITDEEGAVMARVALGDVTAGAFMNHDPLNSH